MPEPDPNVSLAASSSTFASVLSLPCKRHAAKPGQPCWIVAPNFRALCGRRIAARGFRR